MAKSTPKEIIGQSLGFYLILTSILGIIIAGCLMFDEEFTMHTLMITIKFYSVAAIFVAILISGVIIVNKFE